MGILAMLPIFFPLLTLTKRFSLRIGDITHCFRVPVSMLRPRHILGAPLHGAICGRRRRDRTARVPQKDRPDDVPPAGCAMSFSGLRARLTRTRHAQ